MKATWLYSKHPVIVDTDVAVAIGLKEAVVAQQLNYWLHSKAAKTVNGRRWVYNTYENWQKDSFPFFTVATIRRLFEKLEKMGVVITGNYNKAGFDKTKWYSIDEKRLNDIIDRRSAQNEQTSCSKRADGAAQNEQTYTRDYTDNTTDKDIYSSASAEQSKSKIKKNSSINTELPIYKDVINYLNEKLGAKYKPNSAINKRLIDARAKEGYSLDDFKQVIDNKCATWSNDPKMSKYLRPQTLFGTKFESYLNEKVRNMSPQRDFSVLKDDTIENIPDDELPF
ncbi:MAG: conserved phage C-terminal domain-containing protein [Lactobacillus sp.]|nr:conserved phage C-terminal domain-containing protein [Lactobacillus sp.]